MLTNIYKNYFEGVPRFAQTHKKEILETLAAAAAVGVILFLFRGQGSSFPPPVAASSEGLASLSQRIVKEQAHAPKEVPSLSVLFEKKAFSQETSPQIEAFLEPKKIEPLLNLTNVGSVFSPALHNTQGLCAFNPTETEPAFNFTHMQSIAAEKIGELASNFSQICTSVQETYRKSYPYLESVRSVTKPLSTWAFRIAIPFLIKDIILPSII